MGPSTGPRPASSMPNLTPRLLPFRPSGIDHDFNGGISTYTQTTPPSQFSYDLFLLLRLFEMGMMHVSKISLESVGSIMLGIDSPNRSIRIFIKSFFSDCMCKSESLHMTGNMDIQPGCLCLFQDPVCLSARRNLPQQMALVFVYSSPLPRSRLRLQRPLRPSQAY